MSQALICRPCGKSSLPFYTASMSPIHQQNAYSIKEPKLTTENLIWRGFKNRFGELGNTFVEHPVIMLAATAAVITFAVSIPPVGWFLAGFSTGLILSKGHDAYRNRSLEKTGETAADMALLGAGFALGGAAKAAKIVNSTRAGTALHLADDVAAGIMVTKSGLQH